MFACGPLLRISLRKCCSFRGRSYFEGHVMSIFVSLRVCVREAVTHCVDPGQLLGELQHDGNDHGLPVDLAAEELQDGHLPLHVHPPLLLLHLRQHGPHILPAGQPPQACTSNGCKK